MKYVFEFLSGRSEIKLSKAFKNFGWLFSERLLRLVVGFFLGVLVARYLGAETFGQLSYALAYTAFFQAISNVGVDAIVVRDMAREKESVGAILISILKLKVISAFLCVFVGVAFAFVYLENSESLINIIVVISSILFSLGNVIDLFFQSQSSSKLTVLARLESYAIQVAIKIIVIFFSLDSILIFILIPLEALLVSIFLLRRFVGNEFNVKVKLSYFDKHYIIKLLGESWPLAISSVSVIIFMKVGIVFVEYKLGFSSVGVYSIGANLAEMSYMFPTLLLTSFAPVIAKAKKMGNRYYKKEILSFFKLMYLGSISFVLCIGTLGYLLIPYIYGAEYAHSQDVFIVHIFTLIPVALGCAQSSWLINEGLTKVSLYQALLGAILAILLSGILIDIYGVVGAAMSILIAQIVQSLFANLIFCPELFKITWKTILLR